MKKGSVALLVLSALLCFFSTRVTGAFAGVDMPGGKRSSIFDIVSRWCWVEKVGLAKCREVFGENIGITRATSEPRLSPQY